MLYHSIKPKHIVVFLLVNIFFKFLMQAYYYLKFLKGKVILQEYILLYHYKPKRIVVFPLVKLILKCPMQAY